MAPGDFNTITEHALHLFSFCSLIVHMYGNSKTFWKYIPSNIPPPPPPPHSEFTPKWSRCEATAVSSWKTHLQMIRWLLTQIRPRCNYCGFRGGSGVDLAPQSNNYRKLMCEMKSGGNARFAFVRDGAKSQEYSLRPFVSCLKLCC